MFSFEKLAQKSPRAAGHFGSAADYGPCDLVIGDCDSVGHHAPLPAKAKLGGDLPKNRGGYEIPAGWNIVEFEIARSVSLNGY